ncbi:MAG: hypothetical protein B9S32_04415 [Verrucomicrobia bacterium Tous-C9LFEB]|nr:MAG: hypothetical protein B9S32_04415 [Verrucomicrobia bacterium Tous-C9LFEB]
MNFTKHYDVIVAGAGMAGIAAALETARSGLRTALVEKTVFPGGLATSGLVYFYLPICDGYGRQVNFGIAEELLHVSYQCGPGEVPANWRQSTFEKPLGRYRVDFSPAAFILALDYLLTEANVDIWYDTLICQTIVESNRAVGLEVENKSGRGGLRASIIIDATGDGDVCFRAGCPFDEETNKTTLWAMQASLERAREAVAKNDGTRLMYFHQIGSEGKEIQGDIKSKTYPWKGTDGRSVSNFLLKGRSLLREHYEKMRGKGQRRQDLFPVTLPAMAQFRTTRAIRGRFTLMAGMAGQRFEDSIALAADWRKRGSVWEIPYGCLIPSVTGLITAGRCISSVGDAWEVTRSIPIAAHTGQVAGISARLSIAQNRTPDTLPITDLHAELRQKQMPYHLADLAPQDEK